MSDNYSKDWSLDAYQDEKDKTKKSKDTEGESKVGLKEFSPSEDKYSETRVRVVTIEYEIKN